MVNERGVWNLEDCKTHTFDGNLATAIYDDYISKYNYKSIADIGCGKGTYLKYYKMCDKNNSIKLLHGYEGTKNITKISDYKDIHTIDLTKPNSIKNKYDLVTCIEVGEHIPKEYVDVFLDNLTKFVGRMLIITWAIPNQDGLGHVNCQYNSYVIDKLEQRNLTFNQKETCRLRSHEFKYYKWYLRTNLMVFERM
jgi:hypothetical protein